MIGFQGWSVCPTLINVIEVSTNDVRMSTGMYGRSSLLGDPIGFSDVPKFLEESQFKLTHVPDSVSS